MTINNKPSPPTFLHAQETCKNKSAIGSTLLRKRKGEKETLVMAQSENYKQLASVLPHAIINHISLRINKNGEREKITKTDKHHYTPTTRKKNCSHQKSSLRQASFWDGCLIQNGRYACANTSNGNKTPSVEAWKTSARTRGEGVTPRKNTFFFSTVFNFTRPWLLTLSQQKKCARGAEECRQIAWWKIK